MLGRKWEGSVTLFDQHLYLLTQKFILVDCLFLLIFREPLKESMFEAHAVARNSLILRVCILLWPRIYWQFSIKWKSLFQWYKPRYIPLSFQNSLNLQSLNFLVLQKKIFRSSLPGLKQDPSVADVLRISLTLHLGLMLCSSWPWCLLNTSRT